MMNYPEFLGRVWSSWGSKPLSYELMVEVALIWQGVWI